MSDVDGSKIAGDLMALKRQQVSDIAMVNEGLQHVEESVDKLARQTGKQFDQVNARFERIDDRFDKVDARLERIDDRFDKVDARFERIDDRFDKVDARFERIDDRLDKLDGRVSHIKHWVIGAAFLIIGADSPIAERVWSLFIQ